MDTVSAQIDTAMAPFHEELARLDAIHGVNKRTAEVLIERVDGMKRLASRLTWWRTLPHKSRPRSTPQGERPAIRRAREGKQIYILAEGGEVIEQRNRTEPERFAAVLGAQPRARRG